MTTSPTILSLEQALQRAIVVMPTICWDQRRWRVQIGDYQTAAFTSRKTAEFVADGMRDAIRKEAM